MQLGAHLKDQWSADGSKTQGGVYVTSTNTEGDVVHAQGWRAGSVNVQSLALGGYWSLQSKNGSYVDVVAQGMQDRVKATSTRVPTAKTQGNSWAASVEAGHAFEMERGWMIEPQVQLRWMTGKLDRSTDLAGQFTYDRHDSLRSRVGGEIAS